MTRPGVYVSEAPLSRVVSTASPTETYGAFLGTALKGPVTPTRVNSWSDFVATFGGFGSSASLPLALYQFFANGGRAAYVARVLSSGPTGAAPAQNQFDDDGDPAARLNITSVTGGSWGNTVSIDIVNPDSNRFTLTVSDIVRGSKVVAERFTDLSMNSADPRYVVNIVNSQTIGSGLVSVQDITDSTRTDQPLTGTGVSNLVLAGGSDGDPPDDLDYVEAFEYFDEVEAMLVWNLAGNTTAVSSIAQKVALRGDSILVVDCEENASVQDAIALPPGNDTPEGSYVAAYYPWIWIADPSPGAPRGGIMKVPPGASAAGLIVRSEAQRGVFKAPAGMSARITNAVANEFRLTTSDLDKLSEENINVIRPMPGAGITAMGARTRSYTTAKYISVRRTLNYVKKKSQQVSRFALFQSNTPGLWDQLRVVNGAWLSELWQQGGLAGIDPTQAYYVKCDAELNTPQTVANGEVHLEIGVSPSFPAEFVIIRVGQFESDASVVITEEV